MNTVVKRSKIAHYPVRYIVRITQRQADSLSEIKRRTTLSDSDMIRDALEQWIPTILYTLDKAGK